MENDSSVNLITGPCFYTKKISYITSISFCKIRFSIILPYKLRLVKRALFLLNAAFVMEIKYCIAMAKAAFDKTKVLFTRNFDLNLRKELINVTVGA